MQGRLYQVKRYTEINYPNGYREIIINDSIVNNDNNKKGGRKGKKAKDVSASDKERKIYRAKKDIRRIALLNGLTRMVTINFESNLTDLNKANEILKIFFKRIRKTKKYKKIRYLAVPELQQRGAIHYHILISHYIPQKLALREWRKSHKLVGKGGVYISHVGIKGINYVLKYMQKNMMAQEFETDKGYSNKCYLNSKNLKRDIKQYKKDLYYTISRKGKVIGNRNGWVEAVNLEIEEAKESGRLIWDNESEYTINGVIKKCRSVLLIT